MNKKLIHKKEYKIVNPLTKIKNKRKKKLIKIYNNPPKILKKKRSNFKKRKNLIKIYQLLKKKNHQNLKQKASG